MMATVGAAVIAAVPEKPAEFNAVDRRPAERRAAQVNHTDTREETHKGYEMRIRY